MPFFSVIIPLYNKENHIAATLRSALKQTFTDFEIIIINDGSTDNSDNEVKAFNDLRIKYFETCNSGVSAARNKGIAIAQGTIIAFLDADDYWEENHLKELYKLHEDFPEAGMLVTRYTIRLKGKTITPQYIDVPDNYRGIVPDPFKASLRFRLGLTPVMGVPKSVIDVTGPFDEGLTNVEDTDFWVRVVLKYPLAVNSLATMTYNLDVENGLSGRKMADRKVPDYTKFEQEEEKNKSLKAFIDIYRLENALRYRLEGNTHQSKLLYKMATPNNIPATTKLLFLLPPFILRQLLQFKRWLVEKGITFSVYN